METTGGLILLAIYAATAPILWRLIRTGRRTGWLAKPLNREYLMLAHIALLLAGGSFLLDGLLG